MKLYHVTVTAYCPAPRKREFTIKGSNEGVVARRGIEKMRELDDFKGKHIDRWSIEIKQ